MQAVCPFANEAFHKGFKYCLCRLYNIPLFLSVIYEVYAFLRIKSCMLCILSNMWSTPSAFGTGEPRHPIIIIYIHVFPDQKFNSLLLVWHCHVSTSLPSHHIVTHSHVFCTPNKIQKSRRGQEWQTCIKCLWHKTHIYDLNTPF